MDVKYFCDTDTALFEFNERPIKETFAVGENVCIDIDDVGNVVSMTIEHAKTNARLPGIHYEEIGTPS